MLEKLDELGGRAARGLKEHDFIRVISHSDADGLTSAGILLHALHRLGIGFHATIVSRLEVEVVEELEGPTVFCDMGSGQPDLVERVDGPVYVFDHHTPQGDSPARVHVNPHLVGIDGAFELSASGTVYSVARQMGKDDNDNVDLAGLALTGAYGDRQAMIGANQSILREAREAGVVETTYGLKMGDGDLRDLFRYVTDPCLDITGEPEEIDRFLEEVGVDGRMESLSEEEMRRLTSAVVLKLLPHAGIEAIEYQIGEILHLPREVVCNVFTLNRLLNACGKSDEYGLGLRLCLRDEEALPQAMEICKEFQMRLIGELKALQGNIREGKSINYGVIEDNDLTGMVAGAAVRYLFGDRPLLILNRVDGKTKASARGNSTLVREGLDLSIAMRDAAEETGGVGGGHTVASGAAIPAENEDDFVRLVDEIVSRQMGVES